MSKKKYYFYKMGCEKLTYNHLKVLRTHGTLSSHEAKVVQMWLSVDPLAEKYPAHSPYNYCLQNPVILRDPDGRDPITGIIDALSSFALDVGMDYFGGRLIEGKTHEEAFADIGWWSAGLNAGASYAISAVTPTGTATAIKIAKVANSKIGKIVISVVSKMTTKAIDNYSKGKYDDVKGEFDFNQVDLLGLFWESAIETLIEQGLGSKAGEVVETLKKENKSLYDKLQKQANKIASGDSAKRVKKYAEVVSRQETKRNDAVKNLLKTKATEKVITGSASKEVNKETNPTQ